MSAITPNCIKSETSLGGCSRFIILLQQTLLLMLLVSHNELGSWNFSFLSSAF